MKHLKLFENDETLYCLVDWHGLGSNDHSFSLFATQQEAEDYIIDCINDEKETYDEDEGKPFEMFIDYDEASDWLYANVENLEMTISYQRIPLETFEPSKEMKRLRELKKYNL